MKGIVASARLPRGAVLRGVTRRVLLHEKCGTADGSSGKRLQMPEFARKRNCGPMVTTMDCADDAAVSLVAMSGSWSSSGYGSCVVACAGEPCFAMAGSRASRGNVAKPSQVPDYRVMVRLIRTDR